MCEKYRADPHIIQFARIGDVWRIGKVNVVTIGVDHETHKASPTSNHKESKSTNRPLARSIGLSRDIFTVVIVRQRTPY